MDGTSDNKNVLVRYGKRMHGGAKQLPALSLSNMNGRSQAGSASFSRSLSKTPPAK
jgi:hypothetical protein